MQFPITKFQFAAISLLSAQFVTQTIAIPVPDQDSKALQARADLSGILVGAVGTHLLYKMKSKNKKEKEAAEAAQAAAPRNDKSGGKLEEESP